MPRLPFDYTKTIIYKIVCNDLTITEIYVGSTTDFTRRKANHKSSCKTKDYKLYNIIRANGNWANWTMVEIERYPCVDGNEARKRERFWYEILFASLNMKKPFCTLQDNKECVKRSCEEHGNYKEYHHNWVKNNPVSIQNIRKTYYELHKQEIFNRAYRKRRYLIEAQRFRNILI